MIGGSKHEYLAITNAQDLLDLYNSGLSDALDLPASKPIQCKHLVHVSPKDSAIMKLLLQKNQIYRFVGRAIRSDMGSAPRLIIQDNKAALFSYLPYRIK